MKFAKWVFLLADVYGILVTLPLYNEAQTAQMFPPAVNHPEYYYGFAGVVLAWQVAFLLIARDPLQHRSLMVAAILEKASYGIAVLVLFLQARVTTSTLTFGLIDLMLGILFVIAYLLTGRECAK